MLGWMSAAGALLLFAAGFAAPARAAVPQQAETSGAPAITGGESAPAQPPAAAANAREVAVNACLERNEFGPATAVEAVADGFGDWLVWVADRDDDLWGCNADSEGRVYMNVVIVGDLLEGGGSEFLRPQASPASASDAAAGEDAARDLCVGVAALTQAVSVVTSVPDGMGDSLVWLRLADGQLWMCDASADGRLFVFQPVGSPESIGGGRTVAADAPKF